MTSTNILITQYALPYSKIGSWTTLYNYYLKEWESHNIDVIIGPKSEDSSLMNIEYLKTDESFTDKILNKVWYKSKYLKVFKHLKTVIQPNGKYILQVIDNHGLIFPLVQFLENNNIRKQCYIQFFFHGYSPFFGNFEGGQFFTAIDEHVFLTNTGAKFYKQYYSIRPCAFSVLHNGVDSKLFFKVSKNEKLKLRKQFNVNSNTLVFIWCSQDRPKKGLDFILKVWKLLLKTNSNIELWVIGVDRAILGEKVKSFGRVPNVELPKYYQASDFYLFPTLWQEGFGLSLVEALKCGCYCVSSSEGGVPEVLNFGKYGKLIERSNFIEDWLEGIEEGINEYIANGYENPYFKQMPENVYDIKDWCSNMDKLINKVSVII